MRVSPPEDAREFPGPHASTNVTRAPPSSRRSAVHPPNAPAPTTATCALVFINLISKMRLPKSSGFPSCNLVPLGLKLLLRRPKMYPARVRSQIALAYHGQRSISEQILCDSLA